MPTTEDVYNKMLNYIPKDDIIIIKKKTYQNSKYDRIIVYLCYIDYENNILKKELSIDKIEYNIYTVADVKFSGNFSDLDFEIRAEIFTYKYGNKETNNIYCGNIRNSYRNNSWYKLASKVTEKGLNKHIKNMDECENILDLVNTITKFNSNPNWV